MAIQLLIARHGNTLNPGEPPRRVGARTDDPLVETEKASAIGRYLKTHDFIPDAVFSSPLKRTHQTVSIALETAGFSHIKIQTDEIFREIDYGPDENRVEDEVIARVGQEAIAAWNEQAKVPEGWLVDPAGIEQDWLAFGKRIEAQYPNGKILVMTSNGIARFSPILFGDKSQFLAT